MVREKGHLKEKEKGKKILIFFFGFYPIIEYNSIYWI